MPPKAKFTKEEIVEAALNIVREDGISNLTARALGSELGSSARPIFTVFQNMDEVQQAVIDSAKQLYADYIQKGLAETPAFKGVGMQYILFSINEPTLFQLLFMKEQAEIPDLPGVLMLIDDNFDQILNSIKDTYQLDDESSKKMYQHLWIYTHGIAALCATRMCRFTGEEISGMITEVFTSLLKEMKSAEMQGKAGKSHD
ncbi:MAG: TetR/AcrR family transcriptional regulator [Faecalicatena sp.]|uniref:TetR/AcrR family transcriptional regulator n=1 Tax=Faecalicatena sp. TaxID=2005360 RepID=UPI0025843E6A|nr:TetR/AcrR family transcriptional regulator [Faecalicatena sp.]MCI6467545.1 TetR/AcrR family transcriptional regulator [Faecalicatena sp.]MDY5619721.1 TetR/AcrR family transcriptional regulator [Lachnospiraceae bacterium]